MATTTASASTSASASASSGASGGGGGGAGPSRKEVQALLGQFDAKINQMMDYPAKDVINALTMLAERVEYAPEIVSFLETKIHRAPPNYKLPIFYLTDSILKNVRGPYVALLGRNIVPLYCNCVRQVSGKDLRRFVHVLNTWDQTRLFSKEALAQMRTAANRALATAEPSAMAEPVSFSQEPPPPRRPVEPQGPQDPQQDMELRSLLTEMQNDMGIHPTEHLTLEQVRVQNPEWYKQLVDYHAASKQPPAPVPEPIAPAPPVRSHMHAPPPSHRAVPPPRGGRAPEGILPPPARDPRRTRFANKPAPGRNGSGHPTSRRPQAPPQHAESSKSGNVAHLMELLKRKKESPPPPEQPSPEQMEITNDPSRTPNAAAVMSILQKLKGLNGSAPPNTQASSGPTTHEAASRQPSDSGASKMWFSDKIVAHKDRVESNVQKLYAALPLVCRESGLRFKEQDKLNAHLDFLFQYNRAQKERGKGGVSRSWYPDEEHWVSDFSGETAPRETTSSSFFDRKESEDATEDAYENARVPVDEAVTRCRICGENFTKSWDEEEEDWMYTNAVHGTIHDPTSQQSDQRTIFHKYCYDTVMTNSKHITPEHLIPGTPQAIKTLSTPTEGIQPTNLKRELEEDSESDDDDDDVKRVKVE